MSFRPISHKAGLPRSYPYPSGSLSPSGVAPGFAGPPSSQTGAAKGQCLSRERRRTQRYGWTPPLRAALSAKLHRNVTLSGACENSEAVPRSSAAGLSFLYYELAYTCSCKLYASLFVGVSS
jgi:hypothetical protein